MLVGPTLRTATIALVSLSAGSHIVPHRHTLRPPWHHSRILVFITARWADFHPAHKFRLLAYARSPQANIRASSAGECRRQLCPYSSPQSSLCVPSYSRPHLPTLLSSPFPELSPVHRSFVVFLTPLPTLRVLIPVASRPYYPSFPKCSSRSFPVLIPIPTGQSQLQIGRAHV